MSPKNLFALSTILYFLISCSNPDDSKDIRPSLTEDGILGRWYINELTVYDRITVNSQQTVALGIPPGVVLVTVPPNTPTILDYETLLEAENDPEFMLVFEASGEFGNGVPGSWNLSGDSLYLVLETFGPVNGIAVLNDNQLIFTSIKDDCEPLDDNPDYPPYDECIAEIEESLELESSSLDLYEEMQIWKFSYAD